MRSSFKNVYKATFIRPILKRPQAANWPQESNRPQAHSKKAANGPQVAKQAANWPQVAFFHIEHNIFIQNDFEQEICIFCQ